MIKILIMIRILIIIKIPIMIKIHIIMFDILTYISFFLL